MPTTQHQQPVVGAVYLVELAFSQGTQRLATWPLSVTSGGYTWLGLGTLLGVRNLSESADSGTEKLEVSLSIADTAMLAATLGSVEGYRGKRARVYLQLLTETGQPAGTPVLRWSGYMDKVSTSRKTPEGDEEGEVLGEIVLGCSRAGLARARNREGLRLTHAQQQLSHPGDTGLRYVRSLIQNPALWISKRFQEV